MLSNYVEQADDCWGANDRFERGSRNQLAVRWYSANLRDDSGSQTEFKRYPLSSGTGGATSEALGLERTDAPSHRHSSDVSIDHAVGKAIAKHKLRDFAQLSKEEHCVLHWQKSNVEFALGANVSDLSMKFWDSDERHAFEGDHVLLKEGYSTVVDYLVKQLEEFGDDKFQYLTDFPIGKIEYARRSTTLKYPDRERRKLVELSDACAVTTEDGSKTLKFDFVVCTLPLGVLKHYVSKLDQPPRVNENADDSNIAEKGVLFDPPLPLSKQDAIQTVGFGLLDKLYLQFPSPFWREPLGLEGEKYLFGNASGVHQHHYMFTDVGLVLGDVNDAPPILMTLISGKDAVKCETLTQDEIVKEVMETLQELLSPIQVPEPVAVRRTKWGMDKFSRGCYTFLPPGATDQDFQMLQSPVNGNGDSLVLEGSETMRMFFAGEHTTSLHPSMSHGALLSGIRAAKEVISTMSFSFNNDKTGDRLIPVALFRRDNPDTELECSMCHEFGSRVREGSLLAFKRGARQVLVHNNCAEFSPEVEVYEGQWSNVIRASNRGRSLNCTLCGKNGATIGCTHKDCFRLYHFSCSEDTGWRFDRDGKVFYCDLHRKTAKADEADKVSLKYYQTKTPYAVFRCFLCGGEDKAAKAGKLLAFQRRNRRILVHEKCARYTTVVDVKEDNESRTGVEFGNIFEAIEKAGICAECGRHGATIRCASCDLCYHYPCALEVGWKNRNRGLPFRCKHHRTENGNDKNAGVFQHALFSTPSAAVSSKATTAPSNSAVGSSPLKTKGSQDGEEIYISDSSDESSVEDASDVASKSLKEDIPLTVKSMAAEVGKILVSNNIQLQRRTLEDPWNIGLIATKDPDADKYLLSVDTKKNSAKDNEDFKHGELVRSINGMTIGTGKLGTFKAVLCVIAKELDILIEILRESDKKAEDETTQSVQTDLNIKVEAVKTKTVPGAGGKEATPAAGFAGTDAAPIDRSESDKKLSEKGSDSAKESVSAEEQQEPHRGQEKRQPSADIEMKDATMGEAIINSTTPNK